MRFRKKVLVLCLIMVLSVAAGCGKQDTDNTVDAAEKIEGDAQEQQEESEAEKDAEEIPDDGHFHGEYIVTGEYAKDRIGAEDVLFIDARGWQKAVLGTLKGAIATTWQDLCTCQEMQTGERFLRRTIWREDLENWESQKIKKSSYLPILWTAGETTPGLCGNFWQRGLRMSK